MQFLVLLAALLSSTALAQKSTTVQRKCATKYAARPVAYVKTTTFRATTTRAVSRVITVTPRVTITAAGATATRTTTDEVTVTTSLPGTTDTYTTSQTYTFTQTTSALARTTTTLVQTTTVTNAVTTTVPTPAGFTALADAPGFVAKRNAVLEKREALQARAADVKQHLPIIGEETVGLQARQARRGRQYPIAIQCTLKTIVFTTRVATRTAARTATTTITPRTATRTITVSATSTATEMAADATSIISVSTFILETSTSTSTQVQTSTQTVTILEPSATALAQCAQNNIVQNVNGGQEIGTLTFNAAFDLQSVQVADTTGLGCCVACAQAPNCAGYAQAPVSAGNACFFVVTDGRCNPADTFTDTYNYLELGQPGYTIGNGQCGILQGVAGLPAA